ncbi:MAG: hypothetical protein Q4G03_10120 [Planctomycetia bacterium]|nr:hypothetical protein [Planctomycetia bacterium]
MKRRDAMTVMALAPCAAALNRPSSSDAASEVENFKPGQNKEFDDPNKEEEFFELLWRCDAPTLVQREEAETELNQRLIEFERFWMCADLTDGQVGAEARLRFQRACERRRARLCREAFATLAPSWSFQPPEADDASQRQRARACGRVTLPKDARVIYYIPELTRLFWQGDDQAENVWRPRFRNSAAEIAPQPDDVELTFETPLVEEGVWELPLDAVEPNDANREQLGFCALAGLDDREMLLPVRIKSQDALIGKFQSFDLTLTEPVAQINDDVIAITLQLQYADAYDAFDSHRVPIRNEDFALLYYDQVGELQRVTVESSQQTQRDAHGVALCLRFAAPPNHGEGALTLECHVPRFWAILQ